MSKLPSMLTSAFKRFVASMGVIALAVCASATDNTLPYYGSSDFTPHWLTSESPELQRFHRVPDFELTNQEGQRVTQESVAGKIYVASFFFSTCPGICPMLRSKLAAVQERFMADDSVVILAHSIRPSTDTLEILQAYARDNGIKAAKWHLLTGDKDAIYALARNAYFADEDLGNPASNSNFLHTENLLLVDQNRHIRGVYNGLSSSSVENLIEDIQILSAEASSH